MAPTPETTLAAFPPPPGVHSNFDNPESIAYRVIVASVIGPAITIPICILRLYTKRCILRQVRSDDYAIVVATLLALGFSIVTSYHTTNGLGRHIWDVPAIDFYRLMKIGDIAGPIFYNLSTLFTKVSICLFYLRLSPYKSFRIATYTVMIISIGYNIITAFGFVWVCQPIEKFWDFSIITGKCIDLNAFFLATACINAATDLALIILPIFIIKILHLPWTRKLGVAFILMTGSFVCVVSLIRVNIVVKGMGTVPTDGTWAMVANFIWILIEMWLGIICACLPTLNAFLRRYIPAFRERGAEMPRPFPVVKDPNSDPLDHGIPPNAPQSESGYYSGEISDFSMGTIMSSQSNSQPPETEDPTPGVRAVASDKSLLSSASKYKHPS